MNRCSIDANIVINIFDGNAKAQRTPEQWAGILELLKEFDLKRRVLIIPSLIFVELLPIHHSSEAIDDFARLLQRTNCELVDLSVPVARLAADVRTRSIINGSKITTIDALYIATAELGRADVLYTYDGKMLRNSGKLGVRVRCAELVSMQPTLFGA